MIAPHELKSKTFSRSVRGYSTIEVDEYFDFLIEKYTEVYKGYSELEQRYNEIKSKFDELSSQENAIRSAILEAQKLGDSIVENAQSDAAGRQDELKDRCEAIVEEARKKVLAEKDKLIEMRRIASEFQDKLYRQYLEHVNMIQAMDLDPDVDGEKLIVQPAESDFESAKQAVLGPDPDVITDLPNE